MSTARRSAPPPELALVDELIEFLEHDLALQATSPAPASSSPGPALSRYDVMASLGWLVLQQASSSAAEKRTTAVLRTLAEAWLALPTQSYDDTISASLSTLHHMPTPDALDGLFE